jgi:hypothetical protein
MEGKERDHFVYVNGEFIGHVWATDRQSAAHRAGWLYNINEEDDELFISTKFRGKTL